MNSIDAMPISADDKKRLEEIKQLSRQVIYTDPGHEMPLEAIRRLIFLASCFDYLKLNASMISLGLKRYQSLKQSQKIKDAESSIRDHAYSIDAEVTQILNRE